MINILILMLLFLRLDLFLTIPRLKTKEKRLRKKIIEIDFLLSET